MQRFTKHCQFTNRKRLWCTFRLQEHFGLEIRREIGLCLDPYCQAYPLIPLSLSLLQAGLNPSGEGSATWVLRLHSALFPTSIRSSRKSSMLYFTTSIHLFLCLPLLRCPCTSASKILLTQSSSSRRCTCPNHLNLVSRTLSVMHATPRTRRMSSFIVWAANCFQIIHPTVNNST